MTASQIRKSLIKNGIKNLEEFGYTNCVTTDNILTDYVYRSFFKGMLEDAARSADIDQAVTDVINQLLKEINEQG